MKLRDIDSSTLGGKFTENVTPSDTARFAPSMIQVGDAGTVSTISANNATINHGTKAAGDILLGWHIAVRATGTSATVFIRNSDD